MKGGEGDGRLVRAALFLALGLALGAGCMAIGPGNIAGMPGGRMLCLAASPLGPAPRHVWSAGRHAFATLLWATMMAPQLGAMLLPPATAGAG